VPLDDTGSPVIYHLPSNRVYSFGEPLEVAESAEPSTPADDSTGGGSAGGGPWSAPNPKVRESSAPFAFYNSSVDSFDLAKGVSVDDLQRQGKAVVDELQLNEADALVVPITLNHSMGMGFGVMAALESGASIILPSPTPDAAETLDALISYEATVLYADSHTLEALQWMARPGQLELPNLRGGLLKIGSGEALGAEPAVEWLGVGLTTVGKPRPRK